MIFEAFAVRPHSFVCRQVGPVMTQIVSVWFPPADRLLGVAADVGVAHQRGPGLES